MTKPAREFTLALSKYQLQDWTKSDREEQTLFLEPGKKDFEHWERVGFTPVRFIEYSAYLAEMQAHSDECDMHSETNRMQHEALLLWQARCASLEAENVALRMAYASLQVRHSNIAGEVFVPIAINEANRIRDEREASIQNPKTLKVTAEFGPDLSADAEGVWFEPTEL